MSDELTQDARRGPVANDSVLLDKLNEAMVDTIYLDDGHVIDVKGLDIRAALKKWAGEAQGPPKPDQAVFPNDLKTDILATPEERPDHAREGALSFSREFCMPNANTFSLGPVAALLGRYVNGGVVVDPFARNSRVASVRNDIDPGADTEYHMDAVEFCDHLISIGTVADVVLLDPPYSPRQMSEAYKNAGRKVGMTETQNARLYKEVKDRLSRILKPSGIAICCGWSSMGFGLTRGFEMLEMLMVTHGAAHNDTIVTVERLRRALADGKEGGE